MKRNSKFKIQDSQNHPLPSRERESGGVAFLWDESFLWGLMAYRALSEANLPFDLIRSEDIKKGRLKHYRMLFVPGGWASNKIKSLGDRGVSEIKDFVNNGGSYLGFCGGAGLATLDGIGLLNIKRKPTKERVPSFSGKICLNVNEHVMWDGISPFCRGNPPRLPRAGTEACPYSQVFHAWWPSQFAVEDNGIRILATYGEAMPDSFSSDLNVGDTEAHGNWEELEKIYGINLNPMRLRNETAVVEGSYGKGKVVLSLIHFDVPDDDNGQLVLKNLWHYLGGVQDSAEEQKSKRPEVQKTSELLTLCSDLISLGERNFLWYWRNPMLLQWRRGVRGLEYCTLYVMVREVVQKCRSAEVQECEKRINMIKDLIIPFTEKAKRLLVLERYAMQKSHITYERCEDPEIKALRAELFSESKSHGGIFRELIAEIDGLLYSLIKQKEAVEGRE